MASILDNCVGATLKEFDAGTILLSEGETSGRLYVLAEGCVEVLRADTQVAIVGEAGATEVSSQLVLNRPPHQDRRELEP
jgi:CRP/FNR family transcriptional regulator, cyclic AMP receptor protein